MPAAPVRGRDELGERDRVELGSFHCVLGRLVKLADAVVGVEVDRLEPRARPVPTEPPQVGRVERLLPRAPARPRPHGPAVALGLDEQVEPSLPLARLRLCDKPLHASQRIPSVPLEVALDGLGSGRVDPQLTDHPLSVGDRVVDDDLDPPVPVAHLVDVVRADPDEHVSVQMPMGPLAGR